MNKQLISYINGEVNVVKDEFVISREKTSNGAELIFVNTPESEKPMYALWNCKKETKRHILKKTDSGYVIEQVKPKGTGGEPAYVMVMQAELDNKNLSVGASGLLLKLFSCIEWNTCRLIRQRDKAILTQRMIANQFNIGELQVKRLLSELKKANVLKYEKKAYYLNKTLVRKGRS